MSSRFTDQVLIVTGASRGIGAATARLAAARGFAVALNFSRDRAGARRDQPLAARTARGSRPSRTPQPRAQG